MMTTILLADDHRIIRDGLTQSLAAQDDFEVIGQADNGLDALDLAHELKPDIAVLDISMPGLNGIEVARRIRDEGLAVKTIILSMHSDRRFVLEALRAGARGYLLKDSGIVELMTAVRAVCAGKVHLCAAVSEQVVNDFINLAPTDDGGVFSVLSAREREVLQLLAEGQTSKVIADHLNLSAKTVESHRKAIMDKLEIRSVAELTKYAIREGLTPLD